MILDNLNSVLILLPPSEGKTSARKGPNLNLNALSFPELNDVRSDVIDALTALCVGRTKKALSVLGLSANQEHEVERNAHLRTAHCQAAGHVYTGVLYEALSYDTLSAAAKKKADAQVVVASALFGLVRPVDKIPAYRLSGDVALKKTALASIWKPAIVSALETAAGSGVVFDLRSGTYVKLGPIPPAIADQSVVARVLLEKHGKRSVVSHFNKATKGRLVRDLCTKGANPKDPVALADACSKGGYHVELSEPLKLGKPWTMDVVVSDI